MKNRDAELYYTLREQAQPIPKPKVMVDTSHLVQVCVEHLAPALERAENTARAKQPA